MILEKELCQCLENPNIFIHLMCDLFTTKPRNATYLYILKTYHNFTPDIIEPGLLEITINGKAFLDLQEIKLQKKAACKGS